MGAIRSDSGIRKQMSLSTHLWREGGSDTEEETTAVVRGLEGRLRHLYKL